MGIFSDILLTVDFDRTLTAPDATIPERNIEAIRYFMENGGTFTVNTGRSVPMCLHNVIPFVPVNAPLLLYNGSAAYDVQTKKLTQFSPIELDAAQLLRDLQAHFPQLPLEIQGVNAHYLLCPNAQWEKFSENNRCAWDYATPESIPQPFIKASFYGEMRQTTVADMYEATTEELQLFAQVEDYIRQTYGDKVDVFRACARIVDIHAKGVSKLRSAKLLQQELGKKILICIGDAPNDITMLDGADYAYCPADGMIADRYETVCNCAEGAVADVIFKKIPAILQNEP